MTVLVYQTAHGRVYQSDKENCFFIEYKGQEYRLSVCALINLKLKLDAVCISSLLLSDQKGSDLEIIPICNSNRLLVLSLEELIEFKDLIPGVLVMLELNSIVRQRTCNLLV